MRVQVVLEIDEDMEKEISRHFANCILFYDCCFLSSVRFFVLEKRAWNFVPFHHEGRLPD